MEYINVINDNNTTIINDSFVNLSLVSFEQTPWQKSFIAVDERQFEQAGENPNGHRAYTKYCNNGLVFISPNGSSTYNKTFGQAMYNNGSTIYTPALDYDFIEVYTPHVNKDKFGLNFPLKGIDFYNSHSFNIHTFENRPRNGVYGLEVYNENGNMIFTSNNKYLKIKDFIFIPHLAEYYIQLEKIGKSARAIPIQGKYISWDHYGAAKGGYFGEHCHIAQYRYDEPIAVCVLSSGAIDYTMKSNGMEKKVNVFSYFTFSDDKTLNLYAESNFGYREINDDDTGEGQTPNYWVTEYGTFKGHSPTVAIMVIAKNDYITLR